MQVSYSRTGCPRRATQWRSVPSPVFGLRGIFHYKGLLLSHGGSHLEEQKCILIRQHVHTVIYSFTINQKNALIECLIWLVIIPAWYCAWYICNILSKMRLTFAVVMRVLLLFIIRAENLLRLLWFLRRHFCQGLLSCSGIDRLPDGQTHSHQLSQTSSGTKPSFLNTDYF